MSDAGSWQVDAETEVYRILGSRFMEDLIENEVMTLVSMWGYTLVDWYFGTLMPRKAKSLCQDPGNIRRLICPKGFK